ESSPAFFELCDGSPESLHVSDIGLDSYDAVRPLPSDALEIRRSCEGVRDRWIVNVTVDRAHVPTLVNQGRHRRRADSTACPRHQCDSVCARLTCGHLDTPSATTQPRSVLLGARF